ncbi:MAG: hypothetical protein GWN46_19255, partial [Gammaproteobacteria bacterium]|nr:hypothetical protein [Gammaproteobacteria bacterium]
SPIEVDLVAANGTLNLAQTTGLTFVAGGDGTAAMTFRGTIADINAALDGMSFTPALAFEGAGASVQMTTNDLGNSGAVLAPEFDISTVAITVINTPPTMSDQTLTVTENSAVGTLVGTVVASDPDLLDPLTYTILPSVFSGAFSIDPATGEVFVADASVLDFETNPTITLQVQVSDSGSPALSATATITVQLTDIGEDPAPEPSPTIEPSPEPDPAPEPTPEPEPEPT